MPSKKTKQQRYAIIDIETTGGMPKRDKIIEIAIVIHDGTQIIDQWSSLVNPERSVPYEITRITGIDTSMVRDAPKFYEVAKTVVQMTEDSIFVAHNVNFDYSFIREEFDKLGYSFSKRQLCTVKLSRKAFQGLHSHSLGNLIKHFGLSVSARHRALDDAVATAQIFTMILEKRNSGEDVKYLINKGIRETKLPESISIERIHSLPESTGVYYFYDVYGTVIYVGKSINIRSRIMQHFGQITAKSEKLMRMANDIDYTETGSELISLLLESEEIKTLHPEINKAQKTKEYPFFIYSSQDAQGYLYFGIGKVGVKLKPNESLLSYYSSMQAAKSTLSYMRELYSLCEEKIKVPGEGTKRCIFYPMGECYGACKGEEESFEYNIRSEEAALHLKRVFDQDCILVTEGRNIDELGLVLIQDKMYKGYGYISKEDANLGIEEMLEAIEVRYASPESNMIVQQYLKEHKVMKVINF